MRAMFNHSCICRSQLACAKNPPPKYRLPRRLLHNEAVLLDYNSEIKQSVKFCHRYFFDLAVKNNIFVISRVQPAFGHWQRPVSLHKAIVVLQISKNKQFPLSLTDSSLYMFTSERPDRRRVPFILSQLVHIILHDQSN